MAMGFNLELMQENLEGLNQEFRDAKLAFFDELLRLNAQRRAVPYNITDEEELRLFTTFMGEEVAAEERMNQARQEQHEQRERIWAEVEASIADRGGQDRNREEIQRLWGAWQLAHEAIVLVRRRAFDEMGAASEELLAAHLARRGNGEPWRESTMLRYGVFEATAEGREREDNAFEALFRYVRSILIDLEAESRGEQFPPIPDPREVVQLDEELPSPPPLYTPPPTYVTPRASPQQANAIPPQNEPLQADEAEDEAAAAPPPSPPNVSTAPGWDPPTPPNNQTCEELLAQARASLTRVTAARDQAIAERNQAQTQRDNAIARRYLALEAIDQQAGLHADALRLRDQENEFGGVIATAALEQARTERDEAREQRDEAWNRRDEEHNNYEAELADLRRQLEVAESALEQISQAENNRFEEGMQIIEERLLRGNQTTDDGSQTTNHSAETIDEGESPCVDIENQLDTARALLAEAIRARDQARRFLTTRTTERDAEREEKTKLLRDLIDAGGLVVPAYEECVEARDAAQAEIDRLTFENEALVRVSAEAGAQVFDELDTLRQELEDANTQIAGLAALRDLVNNVLNDQAPELDDRVQELQDELDRINQEREECEDELANIRQEREDCEESLEDANRRLKGLKKTTKKGPAKKNGRSSETTKVVKTKKTTTTRVNRATTKAAKNSLPLPSPTSTESTVASVESYKTDLDYEPDSASDYRPTGSKKRAAPESRSKSFLPRKTRRTK